MGTRQRGGIQNSSTLAHPDEWLLQALRGAVSATGVPVTPLRALGVSTVYACVNVTAKTISSLPLKLMRREGSDRRREATDHPLYSLLHDAPNPEMTSRDFRFAVQAGLSLRNNAYAQILRDGRGRVIGLLPLHASEVEPYRPDSRSPLRYRVRRNGEQLGDLPADRVLHLRSMTYDGVCGLDLVSTVRETIGLAVALEDNAARFFGNSSRPGLIIEAPNALSDTAFARLRESLAEKYTGVDAAYRTMILEEGLKAATQRQDNESSQFDESRDRQDKAIARVMGPIPPHKIGIMSDATFSNIEQQNIEWVTDVVLPIVTNWEQALNAKLLTPAERQTYYFKFSLEGLLRGDVASRYSAYAIARQWGWMSVNDIRRLEDMDPIEGGEEYLRPLNMQPVGEAPVEQQPSGARGTDTPPAARMLAAALANGNRLTFAE